MCKCFGCKSSDADLEPISKLEFIALASISEEFLSRLKIQGFRKIKKKENERDAFTSHVKSFVVVGGGRRCWSAVVVGGGRARLVGGRSRLVGRWSGGGRVVVGRGRRTGAEGRTGGGARRGAASTRRALGQICCREGTNLCEELPKNRKF